MLFQRNVCTQCVRDDQCETGEVISVLKYTHTLLIKSFSSAVMVCAHVTVKLHTVVLMLNVVLNVALSIIAQEGDVWEERDATDGVVATG